MAKDPLQNLQSLSDQLEARVRRVVEKHSNRLQAVTLKEHLSGPTGSSSVSRRTGGLARSVEARKPEVSGTKISGGISLSQKYAPVHIGPRGSRVTIRPRSKRFLAIPTDFAKTAAGVPKGPPLSPIWGPTFIAKGVIFGYAAGAGGSSEGSRQRRAAGEKIGKQSIIPLFILKSQVVVPRRIDPQADLLAKIKPGFYEDLKKVMLPG